MNVNIWLQREKMQKAAKNNVTLPVFVARSDYVKFLEVHGILKRGMESLGKLSPQ